MQLSFRRANQLSAVSVAFALTATSVEAQNCDEVERYGTYYNAMIISELNALLPYTHEISRRKKLRLNKIDSIAFEGCRAVIIGNVTLKRKIRRNAHGRMRMRTDVTEVSFSDRRLCLKNLKVQSVSLSRTARIGERFYKRFGNRFMPKETCVST